MIRIQGLLLVDVIAESALIGIAFMSDLPAARIEKSLYNIYLQSISVFDY